MSAACAALRPASRFASLRHLGLCCVTPGVPQGKTLDEFYDELENGNIQIEEAMSRVRKDIAKMGDPEQSGPTFSEGVQQTRYSCP